MKEFLDFFMVTSKYYNFLRNIDSLRHTIEPKTIFWEKNQFFTMISKYYNFLRNIDSLGDGAKTIFWNKNIFFIVFVLPEILTV